MEAGAKSARRRIKVADIIFTTVIVAAIIALAVVLLRQLHLKHEVSAATTVTDRVVRDIKVTDAKDARSLGDTKFQVNNSQTDLQTIFQAVNSRTTGSPSLVRRTLIHGSKGDSFANIYKYSGKQPIYIRVTVTQESGNWKVVGISGNTSEAPLLKNNL